jgi:uncharacterized protein
VIAQVGGSPFSQVPSFARLSFGIRSKTDGANAVPELALPTLADPVCRRKPRRHDIGTDAVLCEYCGAKCCRYFALPIDEPTEWTDFDYIRWYLLHERAAVFIEEGSWYLLVKNRCRHVNAEGMCMIYDSRPQICRDYSIADCEYEDDWIYEHYWETAEQVEEYAEAVLGPRDGGGFRSAKPK